MRICLQRPYREYCGLAIVWLTVHALPLTWLNTGRYYHFEVIQARKLLEYGFWARKGAILYNGWNVGVLPNPADHNYVNHPYPIFWLYTFLYWLFGQVGLYAYVASAGLASCLLTYWFLKRFFPVRIAWFTAALVTAAHATVEFGTNPDVLAQSAIIWPLAGFIIIKLEGRSSQSKATGFWWLGVVVFLAGQMNWFALTTVPVLLLLLCFTNEASLGGALRRPWTVCGWMPLLLGATASFALFIGQVLAYSPSLHANAQYLLGAQMGVGSSFFASRFRALPVLLFRMLLAAPALWFGTLVCLTQLSKNRPERRLAATMLVYLAIFTLVMLTIPRLLLLNQHGFRFLLFPCAVMTAYALACLEAKWLRRALIGIALPSLLLCYAKLHDYQASSASVVLGNWVAAHTKPDEIIFTNLKYRIPPVQSWDVEFLPSAMDVSDRLLFAAEDEAELFQVGQPLTGHLQSVCFLREDRQPLAPALLARLDSGATVVLTTNLVVPPDTLRVFKTGRTALWKLLKFSGPEAPTASGTNAFSLTLYRLSPAAVRKLEDDLKSSAASAPPPKPGPHP